MATISNTPRPGYVWDVTDNVWYPIGVGGHSHSEIAKTIADAKGDLIVGTAADTVDRLAVGNNGETLVADSAATTGLRYSATPSASNPILNSAFQIWQRGTSIACSATAYVSDRWNGYRAVAGATVSRQVTGDTTNLPSIQYAARVQRDSGNNALNAIYLGQSIETVNSIPFAGKAITFSFYARKGANFSAASDTLSVTVVTGTGTDQNNTTGAYTGASFPINASVATLTTTWQRFSFTGTIATTATEMGVQLNYTPVGTAGAADYFEVTGCQIDVGSVALPFRTYAATIQGELAAAQRYYEKSYNQETAPGAVNNEVGIISAVSGNAANGNIIYGLKYAVTKRSTPTLTFYAYTGATGKVSDGGGTALAASSAFTNSTYSGTSGTRVYNNSGGSITAAYGGFEFHFTADAEL